MNNIPNLDNKTLPSYSQHYSEEKFGKKIAKVAKKASARVIYVALLLFYAVSDPSFPNKELSY